MLPEESFDPNWRENAVNAINTQSEARAYRKGQRGWEKIHVNVGPDLIQTLNMACKSREIGQAGYIRRALAIVIAHDLGIDWRQLISSSPIPMHYGRTAYTRHYPPTLRDDGEGFGNWDLIP